MTLPVRARPMQHISGLSVLAAIAIAATADGQLAPPTWQLADPIVLGASPAGGGGLGRPQLAVVAPNGDVVVFGDASRDVRRFTAAGHLVRTIPLPPTCRTVTGLGFIGDTLWLADANLRRFLLYTPNAQEPRGVPVDAIWEIPRETWPGSLRGPALLDGGRILFKSHRNPQMSSAPLRLHRPDGAVETAVMLPVRSSTLVMTIRSGSPTTVTLSDGRTMFTASETFYFGSQPFRGDAQWSALPHGGGFIVADAVPPDAGRAVVTVSRYDATGRQLVSRPYDYAPVVLTEAVRDSMIQQIVAGMPAGAADSMRARIEPAHVLPTVTGLLTGRDGSVWLQRERRFDQHTHWTVLDPSGGGAGEIRLPPGVRMLYADMDLAIAVQKDADDRDVAVRYRIRR